MKRVNYFKLTFDFLMLLVFLILFNTRLIAGQAFHEIAGLAIGLSFVVHLLINWRWIKQATIHFFREITWRTRLCYSVDFLLLLTMGYIMVSGILISKVLFPGLNIGNEFFFKSTHLAAAYFALLLLGIHLGLHWNWIRQAGQKMFGFREKQIITGYIARALMVIILAFGLYTIYSTDYINNLAAFGTAFTQNNGHSQARNFDNSTSQIERPERETGDLGKDGHFEQGNNSNRQNPDFGESGRAHVQGNIFSTILSNLGIIAVFTTITYYLDRLFSRRRPKPTANQ